MFDQYDVYENGMGLSGRGGGGGEKNTSRRKIWQQQKGTLSVQSFKVQLLRSKEWGDFQILNTSEHFAHFKSRKSNRPQLNSFAFSSSLWQTFKI